VNNRWNQWVLNYSRGANSSTCCGDLGFQRPDWADLAYLC
jgi:hypothetical protein